MAGGESSSDDLDDLDGSTLSAPPPESAELVESLAPGSQLGRYRLDDQLGAGGMGVVWRARDPQLDRSVAIKVVRAALIENAEAAARLLREARAMAKVSHRGVVAVFDAGQDDAGRLFIAMELVDGMTLGQTVRTRGRDELKQWRRWLAVMMDAGRGLAAAHAAGVLHRDFKPDNIFVEAGSGRICVGDFGLAEFHAGSTTRASVRAIRTRAATPQPALDESITVTGALIGTPLYMSPEQLHGKPADARSDQFSFCVALYEALYGERPYRVTPAEGQPPLVALVEALAKGEISPPPRDSRVPRWLRDVVVRGLAIDPTERWPDMQTLLRALVPPRRGRWIALGAAGLVVTVLAIALATRDDARPVASVKPLFRLPVQTVMRLSPDGQLVAYSDRDRVLVRRVVAGADDGAIQHTFPAIVMGIAFDAPHRLVAAVREHAGIVLYGWELGSGRVTTLTGVLRADGWAGDTPFGHVTTQYRPNRTSEIMLLDKTGALRELARITAPSPHVAISPDRTRAAWATYGPFAGTLNIVDLANIQRWESLPIPELGGVAWIDYRRLAVTFGETVDPSLKIVPVDGIEARLDRARKVWQEPTGWFGQISVAGGRVVFVGTATTFQARWVGRDDARTSRELDAARVAGALGWDDAGRPLGWDRASGAIVRYSFTMSGLAIEPTPARLDGNIGNATRAGDTLVTSVRRPGARELMATSLADGRVLWRRKPGDGTLVRCAGDARVPCYFVKHAADQRATIARIEPETGIVGEPMGGAPDRIGDVAVSPDGKQLVISDESGVLVVYDMTTTPPQATGVKTPLASTRGVAHDPRGGILVAGTANGNIYQVLSIGDDGAIDVVAQSETDVLSVPRPSPDGAVVTMMGRLFVPELRELRGAW